MAEKICVEILRVTHVKEGSPRNWVRLETDLGICSGNMCWIPKMGEILNLTGNWDVWNGNKQFKFTGASPDIPVDAKTLLHYVCKIASGFGEKLEKEIWEKLGDDWENIKPGDVKGITESRIIKLKEALEHVRLNKSQVDTVAYLISKGCSFKDAEKAWAAWQKEAIGKINANCYCLTELEMIGFKKVDQTVRHFFEIKDDDARRIESGIFYAIRQETDLDGSTIIDYNRLKARCVEELGLSGDRINSELFQMINIGKLELFFESSSISTAFDYQNELEIWRFADATQ